MSSSCNANCEPCAPSVQLFVITVSSEIYLRGAGCLNNDPLPQGAYGYLNYTSSRSSMGSEQGGGNVYDCADYGSKNESSSGNSSAEITLSTQTNAFVDKFGDFRAITYGTSSVSANGSYNSNMTRTFQPDIDKGGCSTQTKKYTANGVHRSSCQLVPCLDPCDTNPCGYWDCQQSCSSSNSLFEVCPDYSGGDSSTACGPVSAGCIPDQSSCTSASCSYSDSENNSTEPWDNGCINGPLNSSYSISQKTNINITNLSTLEKCKGYSTQSVNTKMSIYEANKEQNCYGHKCGDGDKDNCWVGWWGSFPVVDTTTRPYYSRAKIKVAIHKDLMKNYKSIGGTVYFYENTLPGCSESDSPGGTLVAEVGFTLGDSPNFRKKQFIAQDVYILDNDSLQDYAGSTIVGYAKVDKVTFKS